MNIGFLHPGEMGVALARAARRNGHVAHWASAGRSGATRARAEAAGLVDDVDLGTLAARCEMLVSICPPQVAQPQAEAVAVCGFRGHYVEANAIAPTRVRAVSALLRQAGARFTDAALVGPPPATSAQRQPAPTRLLLAGPDRAEVGAALCADTLIALDLGDDLGRASALKLLHSALHKGLLALQLATFTAATREGLLAELDGLFLERPDTAAYVRGRDTRMERVQGKAQRFAAEMDELATLLQGFPAAAAEIFRTVSVPAPAPRCND